MRAAGASASTGWSARRPQWPQSVGSDAPRADSEAGPPRPGLASLLLFRTFRGWEGLPSEMTDAFSLTHSWKHTACYSRRENPLPKTCISSEACLLSGEPAAPVRSPKTEPHCVLGASESWFSRRQSPSAKTFSSWACFSFEDEAECLSGVRLAGAVRRRQKVRKDQATDTALPSWDGVWVRGVSCTREPAAVLERLGCPGSPAHGLGGGTAVLRALPLCRAPRLRSPQEAHERDLESMIPILLMRLRTQGGGDWPTVTRF